MNRRVAGIDVHKRVLMVAVAVATTRMIVTEGEAESQETIPFEMRRFGNDGGGVAASGQVTEVVMESWPES